MSNHDVLSFRQVLQGDEASSGKCPHCGKNPAEEKAGGGEGAADDPLSLTDIASGLQRSFREYVNPAELAAEVRPHLTLANLVNVFRFLLVLLMALVSGAAALLPKVLHLLNRTLREGGYFVRQATPFLLACVEMVNKFVGGFFLLLAMMWRDVVKRPSGNPGPPPTTQGMLQNRSGGGHQRYLEHQPPTYPYRREQVQRPYFRNEQQL